MHPLLMPWSERFGLVNDLARVFDEAKIEMESELELIESPMTKDLGIGFLHKTASISNVIITFAVYMDFTPKEEFLKGIGQPSIHVCLGFNPGPTGHISESVWHAYTIFQKVSIEFDKEPKDSALRALNLRWRKQFQMHCNQLGLVAEQDKPLLEQLLHVQRPMTRVGAELIEGAKYLEFNSVDEKLLIGFTECACRFYNSLSSAN